MGRDHSCEECGRGGFNDPDGSCVCSTDLAMVVRRAGEKAIEMATIYEELKELEAENERLRKESDEAVADLRLLIDEQAVEIKRLRSEVHDAEAAEVALGQRAATLAAENEKLLGALEAAAQKFEKEFKMPVYAEACRWAMDKGNGQQGDAE